jgi:starch synthase
VSRMTAQKGFDLIEDGLPSLLMQDDVQVVILGAGDHYYERLLSDYAARWPNQLSVQLKFDEGLARQIYAGSDLFLMPSRFEPCGISQMLAMRYGTLPIVRETGGLKDTVIPYNEFTGEGNGFSFGPHNTQDMLHIVRLALAYYTLPEHWKQIVKNAYAGDYSWKQSAVRYMELYRSIAAASAADEAVESERTEEDTEAAVV